MIRAFFLILIMAVFSWITACSGSSGNSAESTLLSQLTVDQPITSSINTVGQVDWYQFKAEEPNVILEIQLTSPEHSELEYIVGVHEKTDSGQMRRLYSDHSSETTELTANVHLNVFVEQPKTLFISVRDLLDDESTEKTYKLNVHYVGKPDGNENFAKAVPLKLNAADTTVKDNIAYLGDVDCYSFKVTQNGVYGINVIFKPLSKKNNLDLTTRLYDANGSLIEMRNKLLNNEAHIRSYLSGPIGEKKAATYYVVVEDNGKDDFDTTSYYHIGIEPLPVEEAFTDDSKNQALELTLDSATQRFESGGALDYTSSSSVGHRGDMDWYRMNLDSNGANQALKFTFKDNQDNAEAVYRIYLQDETGATLLAHDFKGSSPTYQNQIKAGNGSHYLIVSAPENFNFSQSLGYSFSLELIDINDPAEDDDGNDMPSNATPLSPGTSKNGKIAYHGDVDYYKMNVATTSPQILEISLNSKPSAVEYIVELQLKDNIIKKCFDTNGSDGDTALKTSVMVPESIDGSEVYYIKVADLQNDDGDVVDYQLSTKLKRIPTSISNTQSDPMAYYYSEIEEQSQNKNDSLDLELEISSTNQPHYKANLDYLDFRNTSNSAVHKKGNGIVTIESPWIAGFIDYQGDRDFFLIDLGPLEPDTPDTQFYYDLEVKLMSNGPTTVEYAWKIYHDSNSNNIIIDAPLSPDGYFALDGDPNPLDHSPINIVTTGTQEPFWVGSKWAEKNSRFYFAVQDFNYIRLPTGDLNPSPDDDWGYDSPYYFKVILTYHPGQSNP